MFIDDFDTQIQSDEFEYEYDEDFIYPMEPYDYHECDTTSFYYDD